MNKILVRITLDTVQAIFRQAGGSFEGIQLPQSFCSGTDTGFRIRLGRYELLTRSNIGTALVEFLEIIRQDTESSSLCRVDKTQISSRIK